MSLWPRALPRPLRFHDPRHTTATLLLLAGVDPHRVQRIMRHRDLRTTLGTYGHLDVEDLRAAVATLPAAVGGSAPSVPADEPQRAAAGDALVTRLLPDRVTQEKRRAGGSDLSPERPPLHGAGKGFEALRTVNQKPRRDARLPHKSSEPLGNRVSTPVHGRARRIVVRNGPTAT
jgi:hypothetical protein